MVRKGIKNNFQSILRIKGKENDLAFVPQKYVSMSEAMRKYKLSDDDLLPLKGTAIVATKYGQEGVFYPLEAIELRCLYVKFYLNNFSRSLKNSKPNPVTADMIPENLIRR